MAAGPGVAAALQALVGRDRPWARRKLPGAVPVALRNAREKLECEEKPAANAMSAIDRRSSASIRFASSSRILLTNACGACPVVALNDRAKCAWLMHAIEARSATVKLSPR